MNIVTVRMLMKVWVTMGIGGTAIYMILSGHYEQSALNWAYATVGSIAGYWLHSDNAAKQ